MTDLPKPGDIDAMEALIRTMLPDHGSIAGYDDGPTKDGFGKTAVLLNLHRGNCVASIYSGNSGWEASILWSTDTSWSQPIESVEDLRGIVA